MGAYVCVRGDSPAFGIFIGFVAGADSCRLGLLAAGEDLLTLQMEFVRAHTQLI